MDQFEKDRSFGSKLIKENLIYMKEFLENRSDPLSDKIEELLLDKTTFNKYMPEFLTDDAVEIRRAATEICAVITDLNDDFLSIAEQLLEDSDPDVVSSARMMLVKHNRGSDELNTSIAAGLFGNESHVRLDATLAAFQAQKSTDVSKRALLAVLDESSEL